LSVDPIFLPSKSESFETFLLTTLEFQAPKDNFVCKLFEGKTIYLLNGENLFLFDLSFFSKFSLKNFDQFKEKFQIGLRNNIIAKKLTTKSGLVNILGVCPIDLNNFFAFNSNQISLEKLI